VLYSVDYPYEDMVEAGDWFEQPPIRDADRRKTARSNAEKLFRFQPPDVCAQALRATGRVNRNTDPWFNSLSARIVPE
jgi:hypothetical protein